MKLLIGKLAVTAFAAALTLTLGGGSAFAYHCYNASRSDQGEASASTSPAFGTMADALMEFCGVTQQDAEDIVTDLTEEPYNYPDLILDAQINHAAHMAGGLELWHSPNADELWHNGIGIDHLGTDLESFFADIIEVAATYGYDLEAC